MAVGKSKYESWPTGATRAIEILEIKIREGCKALDKSNEAINEIIKKFKPVECDREESKFWKELEATIQYNISTNNRINPGRRII